MNRNHIQQLLRQYQAVMDELDAIEQKIDRLQTYHLQEWSAGNYYFSDLFLPELALTNQQIKVPAHCKLFSLSSCRSKAAEQLSLPHQAISLQLLDNKGKRINRVKCNIKASSQAKARGKST